MFQVHPAHPTSTKAIWEVQESNNNMASFPAQPSSVALPRTLQRPQYAEVHHANLIPLAPELANVPVEYVRRGLYAKADAMITGINSLQTHRLPSTMSRAQIQSTPAVTIPLRVAGPQASYPTHVLALSAPKSAGDATLLLTHALVLAANCSGLPRLPATAPASPQGNMLTLPVLPLTVPSPAAFAPLHSFLYTHSTRALLAALLPSVPSAFVSTLSTPGAIRGTLGSGPALHTLSDHLVRHVRPAQLPAVAQGIAAVWRNAVALGVHDPELWDTLDLAWEVVLGALNLAAGAH